MSDLAHRVTNPEPLELGSLARDGHNLYVRLCDSTDELDMSDPWLLISTGPDPMPAEQVQITWARMVAPVQHAVPCPAPDAEHYFVPEGGQLVAVVRDSIMWTNGDTVCVAADDTTETTFNLRPMERAATVARLRTLADLLELGGQDRDVLLNASGHQVGSSR